MIRFFYKLGLFILIIMLGVIIINNTFQPKQYYWGNQIFNDKIEYFKKNKDKFNTIFLGSSRIAYQINPLVFDSLMAPTVDVKSFNLAVEGAFCPEYYFLYEEFLDSENADKVKFVIMELSPLVARDINILFKDRFIYYLNLEYLKFTSKLVIKEQYPIKTKLYRMVSFWISYLYKFIALKPTRYIVENSKVNKNDEKKSWEAFNGFTPLFSEDLEKPFNTKVFEKIITKQVNFEKDLKGVYVNENHLIRLRKLIEKSKKKNIQLFFVIPPIIPREEVYGLKNELERNVIDVSSVSEYPQLFQPKYYHDPGHANFKGANLITRYIVDKTKNRLVEEDTKK